MFAAILAPVIIGTVVLGSTGANVTQIIITLITSLPAIIAALYAKNVHAQVKTPSGDTLGDVAERTHDLSSVTVAHTTELIKDKQMERISA
jgi:hypothetical protein